MNSNFFNLVTRPSTRTARTLDDIFGLTSNLWANSLASDESAFLPSVDVQESAKHWALMLDVPGVKKEDLKIDVEGPRLTISGQRFATEARASDTAADESQAGDAKWSHVERRFGSFSRSFSLPDEVDTDAIKAEHRDGVLKVVIPKKPTATKKSIAIDIH